MKKIKLIIGSALLIVALALTVSCSVDILQTQRDNGYIITVTYDDNGGAFFGNTEDTLVVDMFRPADYVKDNDGKIRIKLLSPDSSVRQNSGSSKIFATRYEYSLVGWYKTRTPVTIEGNIVDDEGRTLEEKDGKYYYVNEKGDEVISEPTYTYADKWDFDNDFIEYTEGQGELSLTLYAGWTPYFEFDYYYLEDGEWIKMDEKTAFSYTDVHAEGSKTADHDTIWLPEFKDGAMDYSHRYSNDSIFNFPKIDGKTFNSAYDSMDCSEESRLEGCVSHEGTLDAEHVVATDRVKNIYVLYDEGERYEISTAEQFRKYADPKGYYLIKNDLDFSDVAWPAVLTFREFNGKIYTEDGETVLFENIRAEFMNSGASYGGLFGAIGKGAEISNVTFKNVTLYISTASLVDDADYGVFAGKIDEKASLSGISLTGKISLELGWFNQCGENYSLVFVANGDKSKVALSNEEYELKLVGKKSYGGYLYMIDKDTVVKAGDKIEFSFYAGGDEEFEESEFVINL